MAEAVGKTGVDPHFLSAPPEVGEREREGRAGKSRRESRRRKCKGEKK